MLKQISFPTDKRLRTILIALLLTLTFLTGTGLGWLYVHVFSENAHFESFTDQLFIEELSGNTLNIHYTLADPEKYGLSTTPVSLGHLAVDGSSIEDLCLKRQDQIKDFRYSSLSSENQMTADLLLLYYHTRQSLKDFYLLEEVLGPSLGTQAQLPVLLAEYRFDQKDDILEYLELLSCMKEYFSQILEFEQKKSQAGYFMSDQTLDRVLEQCRDFIRDPSSNYLTQIFSDKLKSFSGLSSSETESLLDTHQKILETAVIPAYETLISGLEQLRGTGNNPNGLAYYENGKEYYEYLLQSQVGIYVPVEQLEKRLYRQLSDDYQEIARLMNRNPALLTQLTDGSDLPEFQPKEALDALSQIISDDFPSLENVDYTVKYVHKSMEEYLSPAFYLTPPIDAASSNSIYINNASKTTQLELFTTLAHEGFPGHLYQTNYFNLQNPHPIRNLITSGGYIEGWATYIESYAYQYADMDDVFCRAQWLNRSINLCLYSILDIAIHYRGFTLTETTQFLNTFGITDPEVISEIYQYIIETPSNYLRYYAGYLNFMDLRDKTAEKEGDSFHLKEFHQDVLEIGPVPFPILEKYLFLKETDSQN